MHVLLTNDDGPLDDKACPYIKYFVDEITSTTDWDLSIVVPNQQRSWIGKAHFAGKTLTASYIYTKHSTDVEDDNINKYTGPFNVPQKNLVEQGYQEWSLIDSTPAACADIGIHYLNKGHAPIDLVISGPNFGKNSSNLYILSSGTVGAALESCTHGIKAIALSYEFRSLVHNFRNLKEAAKLSVKLIEKLYKEWDNEVNLYSINIPLIDSLKFGETKIKYAPIMNNEWNSIYEPTINEETGEKQFKWNPDFKKVYKDGLKDFNHTDNRVLLDSGISVTPLKSTFSVVAPHGGEIVLEEPEKTFLVTIDESEYIYKPLVEAFQKLNYNISTDKSIINKGRVFHYGDYEDIDLDNISSSNYFIPSYIYRKALIRKNFLANTVHHYVVKHPNLILATAVPESYQLEIDYAEFLDDALDEAYELRQELETKDRVWILKPSMSDKGQGIRIFKTVDQLQQIFDSFEEGDSDDEDGKADDNGVIISQLRHFVVQEYQTNPLLLPAYDYKKFHLRTYVVCQGNLKVFVYKNILALFADTTFKLPGEDEKEFAMEGHLTNTCLQQSDALVVPFWDLKGLQDKAAVYDQIKEITHDLFTAATSVDKINFRPLDNAIEFYGIDFLVNDDHKVSLLEVNAYPDFKQTGDDLKPLISELFSSTVTTIIDPLVSSKAGPISEVLDLVLD